MERSGYEHHQAGDYIPPNRGRIRAKSISKLPRISEKEVYQHLAHIGRSLKSQNRKPKTIPAQCLECDYVFESRNRFTSSGRCPRCRGEHIQDPEYGIF